MEIALLGLRLVVGLAFAAHGAQKLFGAFGGDGIGGTARSFERIGLRPGKLQAWMAGTTELVGSSLIALGLVTPFAATALIAVMTAAALTVGGGWSLDSAVGIDLTGTLPALGALGAGVLGGLGAVLSGRLAPGRNSGHGRRYAERQAA
jgi:putative oxidoreductase